MLIFLEILSVVLLSACSLGTYKEARCKLNGDLSYLDATSLVELNVPKDLDVALPISYDDYVVPDINISIQEVGKQLNICPLLILSTDVSHESCLINVED